MHLHAFNNVWLFKGQIHLSEDIMDSNVNKKHKDSVFSALFSTPEIFLYLLPVKGAQTGLRKLSGVFVYV